jgi:hypothetical protein
MEEAATGHVGPTAQSFHTAFDPGPVFLEPAAELMRLEGDGQLSVFGTTRNGVQGHSQSANGVQGNTASSSASGVYGANTGGGFGVAGRTTGSGSAIFGENIYPEGWAGNFNGRVQVGGDQHFGSQTRQRLNLWGTQYGIGVQTATEYFRSSSAFSWFKGGVHHDGQHNPGAGGVEMMRLDANGNLNISGVVGNLSDRHAKQNVEPVDGLDVLEKVVALPLSRWSYKTDPASRHIGPMAQDFHTAFNVGTDDEHIATVDADGVALAAIQGLNQKLEAELQRRDAENRELKSRLERLEKLLSHSPSH